MRFKRLIVFAIICNSALSLLAQIKNDRFHAFGSQSRLQLNGYIGPLFAISDVESYFTVDAGVTAGVAINKRYFIGLYGQKLLTKVPRTDLSTVGYAGYTDGKIQMQHVGGVLGYIHKSKKDLKWGVSGSAGIGRIDLLAIAPSGTLEGRVYEDKVIILIPKLFMELNMTRWFKINVSGGYRLLAKVNCKYVNQAGETIPVFNKSDYTKPEFSLSLLFGKFGFRSFLLD
jgi:hypothetical protein